MKEKSIARQAADALDRIRLMERRMDEAVRRVITQREKDIEEFEASLPRAVREVLDAIEGAE
jgi:5,10-methylenetetrahydrofolate reductase